MCSSDQIALNRRIIKIGMIESDRVRSEKSVKIDQWFIGDGVIQIGAPTLVEIDNDLETIEQDMLLDLFENFRG